MGMHQNPLALSSSLDFEVFYASSALLHCVDSY
jgi:hypothetical protein